MNSLINPYVVHVVIETIYFKRYLLFCEFSKFLNNLFQLNSMFLLNIYLYKSQISYFYAFKRYY